MTPIRFFARHAWLGGDSVTRDVVLEVAGERFASVRAGVRPPPDAVRLPGVVLPGLANAHSHAFHRALRGRTHSGAGDFWAWREQMYAVVAGLDPDTYRSLARATYAEMALAGITAVGEFHYLHHGPGGVRYADPNAMSAALVAAAADAGIRLTLLDTCYLQADVDGRPLAGPQLRFGDGSVDAWAARVDGLRQPGGWGGDPLGARGAAPGPGSGGRVGARAWRTPAPAPVRAATRERRLRCCDRANADTAVRPTRACSVSAPLPCTPPT